MFNLKALLSGIIALSLLAAGVQAQPILKNGDRVVFYGDSITEQRLYTRYVQQYLQVRYPNLKVNFYNAGWSGDTAPGGLNRLERDVLSLKPTIVTLFFGMNDGGYHPTDDATTKRFRDGEEGIIKALLAKGIRVIVFTPGAVDPDRNPALGVANYNQNLETLGKNALELATQYKVYSADVFHPMLAFQAAQKAKDPKFTMIPDAVHPNSQGHMIMAQAMLKGFGAEPMPSLGSVDLNSSIGNGLRVVSKNPGQVVLETTRPTLMPFWFDVASAGIMRDSGFLNTMAGKWLIVKGLGTGSYRINFEGVDGGVFSGEQLAAGVPMSGMNFPAAKFVHDMIERKENSYYSTWREVRLPFGAVKGYDQIIAGLMAADEGYQNVIHNAAMPLAKATITLSLAPEGLNLALNKRYEASNPNNYNWGIGGLTDGSWEATDKHTFASGDAPAFPKTVTIDLEQAARIGTVIFGVPPFGSTKTVQVSVSTDGQTFAEVGTKQFSQNKEERATITFPAVNARYVRLTYPDHYDTQVVYSPAFSFTTEVEVYATTK